MAPSHHPSDGHRPPPDDGADSSINQPSDPADVIPRRPGALDPSVDAMWLRHHPPPLPPLGHPRVSTAVMLIAWIAVLVLYSMIRPGG